MAANAASHSTGWTAWLKSSVGSRITLRTSASATAATLSANASATGTGVSFTFGVALASATYPASIKPLKFNHASVTLGGAAVNVKSLTLSGNNTLDDSRRFLGSQYIAEPLEMGLREYTGSLEIEFTDLTQYTRFVAGTEAALVASFVSGTDSVTITSNVRIDGSTPNVGGREILTQTLPIKCVASSTDASAITAVLVNGDATP